MNTVITLYDRPDEWYQDTYICCECSAEFMLDFESTPRFCPWCGVKFEALQIKYPAERGGSMETVFINDKQEADDE